MRKIHDRFRRTISSGIGKIVGKVEAVLMADGEMKVLTDVFFFETPKRAFVIWATVGRLQCFVETLKDAGYASLPARLLGEADETGDASYIVECDSIPAEVADAFIDRFAGPNRCC